MKIIGVLALTSTAILKTYSMLNDFASEFRGKNSSTDLIMKTLNKEEFHSNSNESNKILSLISKNLKDLESGGADLIVMASNSLHNYYKQVVDVVNIPVLNIVDIVKENLHTHNVKKVGVISSQKTNLYTYYKEQLDEFEFVFPQKEEDLTFIDYVIYKELSEGIHNIDSLKRVNEIINEMADKGAEVVILASSNFTYFIKEEDLKIPVIDTRLAYMKKAFELAKE